MKRTPSHIQKAMQKREADDSLRELRPFDNSLTDFYSNDYLGLAKNKTIQQEVLKRIAESDFPFHNGASGSRLLSGDSTVHHALEDYLASLYKVPATRLYNSGYMANLGVLSAVPKRGDTLIMDEYAHACIKEGARLSQAQHFTFRHNDLEDLEKKWQHATGNVYVVVESVYSMDGDHAPLRDLTKVCREKGGFLIVDEAHSTGLYGENGSGLVVQLGLQEEVFCRVHTFGKAIGAHGAIVAGRQDLIDYLTNFSRALIYTTALPVHSIWTIEESFRYLRQHPELEQTLWQNVQFFREQIQKVEYLVGESHAIQGIQIAGNTAVKEFANKLETLGMAARPILAPTVKAGQERIRICLHADHSQEELKRLTYAINKRVG